MKRNESDLLSTAIESFALAMVNRGSSERERDLQPPTEDGPSTPGIQLSWYFRNDPDGIFERMQTAVEDLSRGRLALGRGIRDLYRTRPTEPLLYLVIGSIGLPQNVTQLGAGDRLYYVYRTPTGGGKVAEVVLKRSDWHEHAPRRPRG